MRPDKQKQMMAYLTRPAKQLVETGQLKFASDLAKPVDKFEVQQIKLFNDFNTRNPRADGGRIGFQEGTSPMARFGNKAYLSRKDSPNIVKLKKLLNNLKPGDNFSISKLAKKSGATRKTISQYLKKDYPQLGLGTGKESQVKGLASRTVDKGNIEYKNLLKKGYLEDYKNKIKDVRSTAQKNLSNKALAKKYFPNLSDVAAIGRIERANARIRKEFPDLTYKKAKPQASSIKRAGFEKEAKKFASEADLKDFKLIDQGKKNINKFFKNNPDAINNTAFGRNIKNMMAIRIGQDGNFYSRVMPNEYYLKKAKEGKLFDVFDMKAVKSGSKFVRVPYNINLTPGQFNSAFIEGQVNKLFTKGINADSVKNLNNFLVDKNIRVELPNVGYMGAKPDVAVTAGTKEGTRTFPRIVETLKKMEAPTNILKNFIDIAPLPGPFKFIKKFAEGGLSGGDKSGPPPERGPNPQGLLSLMKRGMKI
jgi:hypothetical protein